MVSGTRDTSKTHTAILMTFSPKNSSETLLPPHLLTEYYYKIILFIFIKILYFIRLSYSRISLKYFGL